MRILKLNLGAAAGLAAALAFTAPAGAQTREVIAGTPGFTNNGGLDIITKAFEAETGIKVTVKSGGMDDIKKLATDGTADAVFLPADDMDQVKGAIKAGTRKRKTAKKTQTPPNRPRRRTRSSASSSSSTPPSRAPSRSGIRAVLIPEKAHNNVVRLIYRKPRGRDSAGLFLQMAFGARLTTG